MEECILNCSGPDSGAIDDVDIFQKPTQFESFTARLQRFKSKFNERNRGSFSQKPFQGKFCKTLNESTYGSRGEGRDA